jgi:hypothetical protein
VNFKGHVVCIEYSPQKSTKRGLCIYVIADSPNGYVCGLIFCYGSTTAKSLLHPELTFTRIFLEIVSKVQDVTLFFCVLAMQLVRD